MAKAKSKKRVTAKGTLTTKNAARSRTAQKTSKTSLRKARTKSKTASAKKSAARTRSKRVGSTWTETKGGKKVTKKKVNNPETGKPKTVVVSTKKTGAKAGTKKPPSEKQLAAREKFKQAAEARRQLKKNAESGPLGQAIRAVQTGHTGSPAQVAARAAMAG